jgi:hypothetical protein
MSVKFSKDHEWINAADTAAAVVGITVHAQDALGDVVFVDLPEVGKTFAAGDVAGVVESVKAAADVYMPVTARSSRSTKPCATTLAGQQRPAGRRLVLQGQAVQPGPARRLDGRDRLRRLHQERLSPRSHLTSLPC